MFIWQRLSLVILIHVDGHLGDSDTLQCLYVFPGVVMGFWALVISGCLFVSTFLLAGTAAFLAAGV